MQDFYNAIILDMGKAIVTCKNKFDAMAVQEELKQEGIPSMISPGSAPGTTPAAMDPFTGIDSNYQVITHNEDAERAVEFLKKRASDILTP